MDEDAKKVFTIVEEIERNNRILDYYQKIENGTLKEEECSQMYKDILYEFDDYKYEENQRNLIRLVNSRDNLFIRLLANKFNCKPNEIHIGRIERNRGLPFDGNVCPYKVVLGDLDITNAKDLDFSNLVYIKGNVRMDWCNNVDLSSLAYIEGTLDAVDSENINLQSLKEITGNLKAWKLDADLSSLKKVGGEANLEWCEVKTFDSLEEVQGDLKISHYTEKMDKLRYVKGTIYWDKYSPMKDLPSLERCEWITGGPREFLVQFDSDSETDELVRKTNKR